MSKTYLTLAAAVTLCVLSNHASAQMSKVETIQYHDDPNEWVLGQVARTATNGVETSNTTYGWKAMPTQISLFGRVVQNIGYDSTSSVSSGQLGTIRTLADGKAQTSTYTDWYRGIPRNAAFPDGQAQSATVNSHGWITSLTGEAGFTTTFAYDAMGRPTLTRYPLGDTVAWDDTIEIFEPVNVAEYGIPAGHWRKITSTGNARKVTYFDAMWRPLLTHEYDASNATTLRAVSNEYDAAGRVVFQSYPSTDAVPAALGTWTTYDALGRPTVVSQNNGASLVSTQTFYDAGFITRNVNPRGYTSETRFQAYEQPTTDFPIRIETATNQSEASITLVQRDVFGKPLSITRRNPTGSEQLTRYYAYYPDQKLCSNSEPETGTTLYRYDAAGNLTRTDFAIPVYALPVCPSGDPEDPPPTDPPGGGPPTGGSNPPQIAPHADRVYDTRNRITSLTFSSGAGNTTYTYEVDGLPATVAADNGSGEVVTTTYGYNKRRLVTSEQVVNGSSNLSIGYGYTTVGHLAAQTVPGLTVAYAPNALGQPTQAGPYATGVSYYPNGALKQFTYGNGIVHTLTQNARQLPAQSLDVGGGTALDLTYSYDSNGNVTRIADGVVGGRQTRDMTYDAQDRLLTAVSPMFGGTDNTARYTYDALDNLKTLQVNGRDYAYVYDANQHLTNVTQGVGGATIIGLQYDYAGNLSNKNGRLYNFDRGNRLRAVSAFAGSPASTYAYDGLGRRVRDTTTGDKISLYSQSGQLVYEDNQRIAQKTQYVYLAGSLVARVRNSTVPATPVLTVPGTSSTGNYTVSWTTVAGANGYALQESVGASGPWADVYTGAGSSLAISGKTNGVYRYQVRACLNQGCSNWSGVSQITVTYLPAGIPTLSAPASATNGNYTVSWTTVSGATSYTLEERLGAGSWSAVYTGAGTSQAMTGKAAGSYGYQVKACNSAGCTGYSNVATVDSVYAPVSAPTLTVPATNTTGSYSVSWTSVASADSYQLEEQTNGGAWTQVHNAAGTSKAIAGKVTGTYGYRVRGCNSVGCGNYSSVLTTAVTLPPGSAPTVTSPGTNSTGAYTVSWTSVSGATSYTLEESINSGAWTNRYSGTALSFAITGRGTGSHVYRAQACNGAGCSGYSATATTQVTLPPTGVPTLTVPATSSTGSYTVSWTAVAAATSYTLQESLSGGAWTTVYTGAVTSFGLTSRGAGTHGYRVMACNAGGCAAYSASGSIVVTLIPPVPTGFYGAAEVVPDTRPPLYDYFVGWNASAGATYYDVQMQQNTQTPTITNIGNGTSWSYSGRGTRTFWVRACNPSGCSAWSASILL